MKFKNWKKRISHFSSVCFTVSQIKSISRSYELWLRTQILRPTEYGRRRIRRKKGFLCKDSIHSYLWQVFEVTLTLAVKLFLTSYFYWLARKLNLTWLSVCLIGAKLSLSQVQWMYEQNEEEEKKAKIFWLKSLEAEGKVKVRHKGNNKKKLWVWIERVISNCT